MALVVHLSDLHMAKEPSKQTRVFVRLVETVRREYEATKPEHAVLVVTGDVFDSGTQPPGKAIPVFLELQKNLIAALGGRAPTIVLPGNHDRRRFGLIGPHREDLFAALCKASDPSRTFVAGCQTPFLAQIVPPALHGLPAHVITYDSTYLPTGLFGAGGTIRVEDLLAANSRLPNDGKPLFVFTHHHFIPTPLTDVNIINASGTPRLAKWAVGNVLPALVSYGDREELTMTALGAGTALSTLHMLGRAVLMLHGHKHVPTARLLSGMTDDCGDLLIASAGSCGTRERVQSAHPDAARLWPSFNVVNVSPERVAIEALSFSPKKGSRAPVRRELARVDRKGHKWQLGEVTFRVKDPTPRVACDEATYGLTPSVLHRERFDFQCERLVTLEPGAQLRKYVDFIHALPALPGLRKHTNRRFDLRVGNKVRFFVREGLGRTLAEGARAYGPGTAFEWVSLHVRYGARKAVLRLARKHAEGLDPFASITDLTTGREKPAQLETHEEHFVVTAEACAPRSLLRIYWPLQKAS